jgi:hypothetical protein
LRDSASLVRAVRDATVRGYRFEVEHPDRALDALLAGAEGLDAEEQRAQLDALLAADAVRPGESFGDATNLARWLRWETEHGILEPPLERPPGRMFSAL